MGSAVYLRDLGWIERSSEECACGAGGRGEVAALVAAARAKLNVNLSLSLLQRRAALGRRAPRERERVWIEVDAYDQRRSGAHDVELLARDVDDGRPQVARVLEPHVGQHRDARVDDVGGVVAPPEPRLEYRDIDPGCFELAERGCRQQLELRHDVAGRRGRAVDQLGGAHGPGDRDAGFKP